MNNLNYPAWLEIDQDKLSFNVRQLLDSIGADRELLAVVKADAYGHGAVPVAKTALANGVNWLGVNLIREALELRQAGIKAPILILGCSSFGYCEEIIRHDLTAVITDSRPLAALSETAQRLGKPALVQIKVDTGMGRLGVEPSSLLQLAEKVVRLPGLSFSGLLSHFPVADQSDKSFTLNQIDIFIALIDKLRLRGLNPPLVHIANSAGVIDLTDYPGNLVRAGIALYGLYPSGEVDHDFFLKPILSFKARISYVKPVPAGVGISYGLTYTTPEETRLAVIPVGYAHGMPRGLSNKGEVLIQGRRCPIRGRVCMDSTIVEVGNLDVEPGDEVVLIGKSGDEYIGADEWAYHLDTINYEIVATLASRLPRLYLVNGKIAIRRDFKVLYEEA